MQLTDLGPCTVVSRLLPSLLDVVAVEGLAVPVATAPASSATAPPAPAILALPEGDPHRLVLAPAGHAALLRCECVAAASLCLTCGRHG